MGTLDTADTVPCSSEITVPAPAHTPVINVHLASGCSWVGGSQQSWSHRVTPAWDTHLSCLVAAGVGTVAGLMLYAYLETITAESIYTPAHI